MTEIRLEAEADIQCPAEKIFDVIIDFRGQDRWLTKSAGFRGTTDVSLQPGDPGDNLSRAWTVRGAPRDGHGVRAADVTVRYTLAPTAQSTHAQRVVTLGIPWPLKLLQPLLVPIWRAEQRRTLLALKAYAETLS